MSGLLWAILGNGGLIICTVQCSILIFYTCHTCVCYVVGSVHAFKPGCPDLFPGGVDLVSILGLDVPFVFYPVLSLAVALTFW